MYASALTSGKVRARLHLRGFFQESVQGTSLQQNLTNRGSQSGAGAAAVPALSRAEDRRYDLVEMAQRDLSAALQLLAQRAEYITQAGGAAIALRRDDRNEMMCHARAGANAPEVGALFSTEIGLSGESVRTAQALRCNDAERDSRVNREICRELGIASVVVMPIVNDDHVMGVFELFSGKTNAFGDRDLAALQRLSEMVGIAVKLASAAGAGPQSLKSTVPASESAAAAAVIRPAVEAKILPAPSLVGPPAPVREHKKKLWSALDAASDGQDPEVDTSRVPTGLRSLRKCDACGFPISPGRSFCVECEEKNWRGRLTGATRRPSAAPAVNASPSTTVISVAAPATPSAQISKPAMQEVAQTSLSTVSNFTLSGGLEPSRSWLSSYKYMIGAVLAAAAVIAALLLR